MLSITVGQIESFDDATQEFVTTGGTNLLLEHSLVSLSKWEISWEKPFIAEGKKTDEETIDYIRCMTLTPDVPEEVYNSLTPDDVAKINEYIQAKMTATWFSDQPDKGRHTGRKEVITNEIIYYWMVSLNIDLEWENRHLNRLLTLIKVCNQKNEPPKKMSKGELMARNKDLNAQRRAQLGTKG